MHGDGDFRAQGGDPSGIADGDRIDLSTCVNLHGPPPAVCERLRNGVRPEDLRIHPYAAAERVEALYARHLGVDESYVDFVSDPTAATVVGADVDNLVVLRSPSTFWGIAATRVGVAWCRDRARLKRLLGPREPRPISGLDVTVAEAAMGSVEWARHVRINLARDAAWLTDWLRELPGTLVERDVDVHYRCLVTEHAEQLASTMARHGIGVRVLGRDCAEPNMLRILAPRPHQRGVVARAMIAAAGWSSVVAA